MDGWMDERRGGRERSRERRLFKVVVEILSAPRN